MNELYEPSRMNNGMNCLEGVLSLRHSDGSLVYFKLVKWMVEGLNPDICHSWGVRIEEWSLIYDFLFEHSNPRMIRES